MKNRPGINIKQGNVPAKQSMNVIMLLLIHYYFIVQLLDKIGFEENVKDEINKSVSEEYPKLQVFSNLQKVLENKKA